ncbi:MAG: hypothetical protein JSU68_11860 [Phycisphaerales bacterium]|nr:MAG: hypothetical protein JSU68_11860 [Phycisphaerales bacterium]
MEPQVTDLIAALPEGIEPPLATTAEQALHQFARDLARKPLPVGRMRRLWTLGTLQAKIAAAYFAWWLRTLRTDADDRLRQRDETHLKAALQVLGTMSYLRGAVMKVGQLLANHPNVVPHEFSDVLGRLYFEAPPMHFSLLREQVRNELGGDPEEIFDDFETKAFAAASFGQVHRARLKGSGQRVAIKIQYPHIGRVVRDDFRNLRATILPMRLSGDWENLMETFDDIRRMLDAETDYEHEAENLRIARSAFAEDECIVVPRVFPEVSTRRVLTMEYLDGVHLDRFLATNPSQELRDRFGHMITLACSRLQFRPNLLYADIQPGNYFFMPDGRLGFIDFGCCHRCSANDVDYMRECQEAWFSRPEDVRATIIRAGCLTPRQQADERRMQLMKDYTAWVWEPIDRDGPFDFSNADYFRRGVALYGELLKRRYVRSLPVNTWITRLIFGYRAMMYHLRARVNIATIFRSESTIGR